MIVNKKLDRFKQWAGERMGGEVRTNTSDDFKALEQEMVVRADGMNLPSHDCLYGVLTVVAFRNGQPAQVHERVRQMALEA